jgi:uncharacterized protein YndB with AHSA1/START domain
MATASKIDTSTLEMRRTLKAPIDKVFRAWTEPEQMKMWLGCCDTTASMNMSQDFQVGGEYSFEIQRKDGGIVMITGTFIEIIPNQKLVYSWNNTSLEFPAKDTLVSVQFIDQGDTTEIVLTHSKFDRPVSVQGHSMGWGTAFDKLEAIFA